MKRHLLIIAIATLVLLSACRGGTEVRQTTTDQSQGLIGSTSNVEDKSVEMKEGGIRTSVLITQEVAEQKTTVTTPTTQATTHEVSLSFKDAVEQSRHEIAESRLAEVLADWDIAGNPDDDGMYSYTGYILNPETRELEPQVLKSPGNGFEEVLLAYDKEVYINNDLDIEGVLEDLILVFRFDFTERLYFDRKDFQQAYPVNEDASDLQIPTEFRTAILKGYYLTTIEHFPVDQVYFAIMEGEWDYDNVLGNFFTEDTLDSNFLPGYSMFDQE